MYRFDNTQWKERGVGELKILADKNTGQHRLIMRRDQIHKLCANHNILPGTDIKPMKGSNKSYAWNAMRDMSDGEAKDNMFAARFKDEEIASEFVDAFSRATENAEASVNTESVRKSEEVILISDEEDDVIAKPTQSPEDEKDGDDVTITSQSNPSEEARAKAKMFLLPESFYNEQTIQLSQRPTKTEALR